ncbi:MAG: zinc ribbon domain-containing protein [Clostridia bacterium]|nr:zinc ribbon domain-containing protein [Clostridia bacterium]MBR4539142.1 zinc ribbon domain-containing protein [Clostridia bacterium]
MALILCPECKREVSDRAHQCPHCGNPLNMNPLSQEKQIDVPKPIIYGEEYYNTQLKKNDSSLIPIRILGWFGLIIGIICLFTGAFILAIIFLPGAIICITGKPKMVKAGVMSDNTICCPRCGSTEIAANSNTKRSSSIYIESKGQWMCKKCGTEFETR